MMTEQNVDNCIRRLFEDVWNRGETELINEICSSNSMLYFGIEASRNRDQLNDPRQSRGHISVSPSKGPLKSALKGAWDVADPHWRLGGRCYSARVL
jgi:hypothetical protein